MQKDKKKKVQLVNFLMGINIKPSNKSFHAALLLGSDTQEDDDSPGRSSYTGRDVVKGQDRSHREGVAHTCGRANQ